MQKDKNKTVPRVIKAVFNGVLKACLVCGFLLLLILSNYVLFTSEGQIRSVPKMVNVPSIPTQVEVTNKEMKERFPTQRASAMEKHYFIDVVASERTYRKEVDETTYKSLLVGDLLAVVIKGNEVIFDNVRNTCN